MKIYLAARYSRIEEMRTVANILEIWGHWITSRWINGDNQIDGQGLSIQAKEELRTRFANEDRADLEESDCIISFTEHPRSCASRGGRHVELGMGLALNKRMIVIDPRENVFHCLPEIVWFRDLKSFQMTGYQLLIS